MLWEYATLTALVGDGMFRCLEIDIDPMVCGYISWYWGQLLWTKVRLELVLKGYCRLVLEASVIVG